MTLSTKLMLLATVAATSVSPLQVIAQTTTTGPAASTDSLFAQTNRKAEITRVNTRVEGTDTFTPGLRIVDSTGAVRYIAIGEEGLTKEIYFNDNALRQYAAEFLDYNGSDTIELTEFDPATPAPCECFWEGVCYDKKTDNLLLDGSVPTIDVAGLTIADQDEAQRIALYATL